jgi:hypothetical protein
MNDWLDVGTIVKPYQYAGRLGQSLVWLQTTPVLSKGGWDMDGNLLEDAQYSRASTRHVAKSPLENNNTVVHLARGPQEGEGKG